MNDRSLARLLTELDAELARKDDPGKATSEVFDRIQPPVPGAVARSASRTQLRSLDCVADTLR